MTTTTTKKPMKVLVDGNWWIRGPISNRSIQRSLVFAWIERFPCDDVFVAVPLSILVEAQKELSNRATIVATKLTPQRVSAILELPCIARRISADITISHNFAPLHGRSAVFIHDFLFPSNPECFTVKERMHFSLIRTTVGRASAVFTSSATEARRIARFAPRAAVPTAVGMELRPSLGGQVTSVNGLESSHYLLTVGRLNARKNLLKTTQAALRSGRISREVPLVIVGEASGKAAELDAEVSKAVASGAVRFLGNVEDDSLRWLYANTALFVFLTLDEGFGMPTLEALSSEAPLLVSDINVFREILGPNATYTDPIDVPTASRRSRRLSSLHRLHPSRTQSSGISPGRGPLSRCGARSSPPSSPTGRLDRRDARGRGRSKLYVPRDSARVWR